MGNQNVKQVGQSPVQIDHPRFENAKVYQDNGKLRMVTTMGLDQKQYDKWKQEISTFKHSPEYLLLPKSHQFSTKGLCGSSGTLKLVYEYYPYLLIEQIQNRKKRRSKFYLSAAQTEMKKLFDCKIGDIRPENIFINQQGQVKISCLYSWPMETSNYQKAFDHTQTLISPQDMNKLQLGGTQDFKNYQSQMFSIGMSLLSAALLMTDFRDVYDIKKYKFKFDEANEYQNLWKLNTGYSEIFTAFVSNLCSFEPQKRLNEKELWFWISKYQAEIVSKEDFIISQAPIKIEKEIQQLREAINFNPRQDSNPNTIQMMNNMQQTHPYLEKSVVYPFGQGHLEGFYAGQQPPIYLQQPPINLQQPPINLQQRHILNTANLPMNPQANIIKSPRQSVQNQNRQFIIEPINSNIQTSDYNATQIPAQYYQKQYGLQQQQSIQNQDQFINRNIQKRVVSQKTFTQRLSSPKQYVPPDMIYPPVNNNFVYTRRIIDPTSNNVIAEERIGQEQYQRTRKTMQEPQQINHNY